MKFLPIVYILQLFSLYLFSCPFDSVLNRFGCDCDYGKNAKWISCKTKQLSTVFQLLSAELKSNETHFEELYVESDGLEEIDENIFKNISFETIKFHNCSQLKNIDRNAFKNIKSNIKKFEISGNNQISDDTIFKIISDMNNLRILRLSDTKISLIPENAFEGSLNYLTRISFDMTCSHSSIKKVMRHAFYDLPNLIHLDLSCLQLNEIDANAFELNNSSNPNKLFIDLSENQLTENSFKDEIIIGRERSVQIILNYNPIKYLNQSIFRPFLDNNPENTIDIWDNLKNSKLDCSSCEMIWLKDYDRQISDSFCSDGNLMKQSFNSSCPASKITDKCIK